MIGWTNNRREITFGLALAMMLMAPATMIYAGLEEYIKKPEPKSEWKLKGTIKHAQGTIYDLHLISQEWHGITWEHQLQVYEPKGVTPQTTMLLYNTGGTASEGNIAFGMMLAQLSRAPVAFLYNIPNQPLFGGKKEDALIAETFVRYLDTKDDTWPLLFPMAKSVVKAMDTLQAFSKDNKREALKGFIISGASKRGWTTWLTGASDPRVIAIAPLVIDTLNMAKQMDYQKESFGDYSDQVADYTERHLVPMPKTDEAKKLWQMVDPFFYRQRLTMPKLLIHGNNDPYWTVDALNLYWDELKGDKYVCYVPNAGHDLKQLGVDKKDERARAIQSLAAFAKIQATGKSMPSLRWKHSDNGEALHLTVEANPLPKAARIWEAAASTRDFRKSQWHEEKARIEEGKVIGDVARPKDGLIAVYADLDYEVDGIPYHLCTQVRVANSHK